MNRLHYTPAAKKKRDSIVGNNAELEQAFQFTEEGLRQRGFGSGTYSEAVEFTNYRLEFEVDRDKMLRITMIEITDISGGEK